MFLIAVNDASPSRTGWLGDSWEHQRVVDDEYSTGRHVNQLPNGHRSKPAASGIAKPVTSALERRESIDFINMRKSLKSN